MTQLEALKADYNTLTENQKLFTIVEDIDTIADRLGMLQDENENSIITDEMIRRVRKLSNYLYQIAEYNER